MNVNNCLLQFLCFAQLFTTSSYVYFKKSEKAHTGCAFFVSKIILALPLGQAYSTLAQAYINLYFHQLQQAQYRLT